ELLKANPDIEVVITDQRMPEINGVEFLRKIIPNHPHSIRMILTGFSDVQAIIESINEGQVFRYITKPWDKDQLKATIDKALSLYQKRKKVQDIEVQLSEKEIEIKTHLDYSRKIQEIILPDKESIQELLPHSFVFYRPFYVVSGDFYWLTRLNNENEIILAVADCPGHGISGGLMSVIGNNLLEEIIYAYHITEPELILEQLDQRLRKLLKQDQYGNQDSISMSICKINKEHKTLSFSGAKSPLVHIQNGVLQRIAGDRYPAGGILKSQETYRSFKKEVISFNEDSFFYLYTDGFKNQFGGEERKKFGRERLQELFIKIHKQSPEDQEKSLNDAWHNWAQSEIQVDDMLIFGFKGI
ncbi:MAG: SpoIIE family protein phosphatase, partial [Bacteroidota bacterium]